MYLSPSGQKGLTHSCDSKVKEFLQVEPTWGQKYDEEMSRAVEVMKSLLLKKHEDEKESLKQLAHAVNQTKNCFEAWGLTEGAVAREMNLLMDQGALAVKPTGSGGGGYILSLWSQEPSQSVRSRLISCW
jgi:mevalonate kinase